MSAAALPTVLFDFDGTLADTAPDMVAALNDYMRECGRAPVDVEQARGLCSGGARALLSFAGVAADALEDAVPGYLRCYAGTDYRRTVLFDGVAPMLQALNAAGYLWGVATNKPAQYFEPIAARLLAPLQPSALIARSDALPAKPHPATLFAAAEQCGVPTERCVYVGDDVRDGAASAAAAMPFIATTWGYWRPAQWDGGEDGENGEHGEQNPPPIAALISQPALVLPALAALSMPASPV